MVQTIGEPTEVTIGTVETLEPGQPASVTNTGSGKNVILNFGFPAAAEGGVGPAGPTGPTGPTGDTGPTGAVPTFHIDDRYHLIATYPD